MHSFVKSHWGSSGAVRPIDAPVAAGTNRREPGRGAPQGAICAKIALPSRDPFC